MIKYCRYSLLPSILGAAFLATGCAGGMSHQQLSDVRATAEAAERSAHTADYHAHQAKIAADHALARTHRIMKRLGMKDLMK